MKRLTFFTLFITMYLANNFVYAGGYEKSIEIYGGPGLNKFSKYSLGIEMINGYRVNNYFSVGFGAGFRYTNALYYHSYTYSNHQSSTHNSYDGKYLIPLHARIKANLSKATVSPFLLFDAGYTIDVGQNKNKNTEGLFLEPAFGVDLKLDEKSTLNIGIGVNLQNAHCKYYSIGGYSGSYDTEDRGMASTLNFRIGLVF